MRRRILLLSALAALPLATLPLVGADGAAPAKAGPVNLEGGGVAIAGFDPVAYFIDGRATPGRPDIAAEHGGAAYRFASDANRTAFLADPERYLPQYGGYCAFGLARGYKAVIDPKAFTIAGGKLYLNYNVAIQDQWRRQQAADIRRADANWPKVKDSREVAQ